MQSENPLIADFVKIMNSAAGTVAGMAREANDAARERAKEFFGGLDFVSRDEFEAVKEMAARARAECEALKARIDGLEARANAEPAASAASTGGFAAGDADPAL